MTPAVNFMGRMSTQGRMVSKKPAWEFMFWSKMWISEDGAWQWFWTAWKLLALAISKHYQHKPILKNQGDLDIIMMPNQPVTVEIILIHVNATQANANTPCCASCLVWAQTPHRSLLVESSGILSFFVFPRTWVVETISWHEHKLSN